LLLGWPGSLSGEANTIQQQDIGSGNNGDASAVQRACANLDSLIRRSPWVAPDFLMFRAEPTPAPTVAQMALGGSKCLPQADQAARDTCALLTRMFQSALDNGDVRTVRALGVNFFYGIERAAVFVLGFVTLLALLHQRAARARVTEQADWILL